MNQISIFDGAKHLKINQPKLPYGDIQRDVMKGETANED